MMLNIDTQTSRANRVSRQGYLNLLNASLSVGEFRFARDAALYWLALFPGDLKVSLLYAQALLGEKHAERALPILEELIQTDPEFVEAAETLREAEFQVTGGRRTPDLLAAIMALGGRVQYGETVATWGRNLMLCREALQDGEPDQAEHLFRQTLASDPATPLAAVTHLQILRTNRETSLPARRSLAHFYHQRWPNCLQCSLLLAEWLMEGGDTDRAVSLLHQAAARDVEAQVAKRLWGEDFPYSSLWPEIPDVPLQFVVPADVAAILGWNQLPEGEILPVATPAPIPLKSPSAPFRTPHRADLKVENLFPSEAGELTKPEEETTRPEGLRSIQAELDQVAGNLKRPDLVQPDGRFPVYVIFSSRRGLISCYGKAGAAQIEVAMQDLAETIQPRYKPARRNGNTGEPDTPYSTRLGSKWGSRVFLADEPASISGLGIKPAKPDDAWSLKLAISDLDAALAKRGERIGALLIIGGPEVVPFHYLPNPVDDEDSEVASDNPYGTRDGNYFIPEWPVGRIPGGEKPDPALIVQSLERIANATLDGNEEPAWYIRWWYWLKERVWPQRLGERPSFGYTAAVWRQASMAVFRPIGDPRSLAISPPPVNGFARLYQNTRQNLERGFVVPISRLGYFNLHGLVDSPEWYGQKDPVDSENGPDYPVALRPEDIASGENAPQIAFTEACYGAHVDKRDIQDALSLTFLRSGSRAFVGSTCMTYGSISNPLVAADLLAFAFWKYLRSGYPAGEALRRAKIHLASEMHERQGYLDGEDQKTLISFVLYGDPLAQPQIGKHPAKSIQRSIKPPLSVKTVCDLNHAEVERPVPPEVLEYIKHVVSQYLPGMEDAHLTYSQEHTGCDHEHQNCSQTEYGPKGQAQSPERSVVILNKQVQRAHHTHNHYARLTLDGQGRLVKLVVSR